jgi:nitric oxide reductase subunit B
VLAFAFWSINIGLALMVLLSDLPRGLLQTVASVNEGMWYARSSEFMQQGIMNILRWMRVIGDTIFGFGVLALGWFVLGLKLGWSQVPQPDEVAREFPKGVAKAGRKAPG